MAAATVGDYGLTYSLRGKERLKSVFKNSITKGLHGDLERYITYIYM